MLKRHVLVFTVVLVLGAACLWVWPHSARAQEGEEKSTGVDVFFVVDNSGSMQRLDPTGLRVAYTHALTDLILSRGGDRVSVVRLGGRLESEEWRKSIVYPLTWIPEDPVARDEKLEAIKKALSEEVEGFGRGSDFNAAFEYGVIKQRTNRPAVVIVVSDGNMEVIEGDRAPQIYLDAAREMDGSTLRDRVNSVAMNRFRTLNLPSLAIAHRDLKTYVIPVGVGKEEGEGRYVLKDLTGVPGARRIIPLEDSLLRALSLTLRAPLNAQTAPWNFLTIKVLDGFQVEAGGESAVEIGIPVEAENSRIIVLGPNPHFAVELSGGGDVNLGEEEGVRIFGRFNRHRVIAVTRREIPNHSLRVQNLTEEEVSFQVAVFSSFDFESHLALPGAETGFRGGETLNIELGLKDRRRDDFASDPWILERLVAVVRLMDASGEAVEKRFPFAGGGIARMEREILLDPRTPSGTFMVSCAFLLVDEEGNPLLAVPPVERKMKIMPGVPIVQVEFLAGRVFVGHEMGLFGEVVSGYPPARALRVAIDHAPLSGEKARPLEVDIVWDAERKGYLGSIVVDLKGRYHIREEEGEGARITRGLRGSLEVGSRGIVLLAENGAPLEDLTFSPSDEEGGGYKTFSFLVSAELLPGETGVLTLAAHPHESAEGASFVVETGKSFDLSGDNPKAKVTLRLETTEGARPQGEVGVIEIQGTLGGDIVRRETAVSAEPRPVEEKRWTDFLRRKEILAAGIGVLAVFLMAVILFATRPRYGQEHLLHERGEGGWDEGALLSDLRRGWNPRNAFGTSEVKNSIQFRLRGRRGIGHARVWARPLKPFIQVYRNNELQSNWVPLEHGDRLRVRGARYEHYYRFFAHPLTPEEYDGLQPEAPVAAVPGGAEEAPEAELIIEIPTEPEVEMAETAEEMLEDTAPEGLMEPALEGFPVEEAPVEEASVEDGDSPLAELETIFEEGPAAPAKEEMAEAWEEKGLSFTDIFGEDEPEAETAPEPTVIEEEEKGSVFDDQETIFEQFFGEGAKATEEEGTDIIPETQVVEEPPGDGTEIVDESMLADAFKLDPEGIFSDGDISKLLEEASGEDGESLIIDVPLDEEGGGGLAEEVFSVGDEEEAVGAEEPDKEEISPELMETQEMAGIQEEEKALFEKEDGTDIIPESGGLEEGDGTDIIPESGGLEEGDGTELLPGDFEEAAGDGTEIVTEWTSSEEGDEEVEGELEVEGEVDEAEEGEGILTRLLIGEEGEEEEEDGFSAGLASEIRSEIEDEGSEDEETGEEEESGSGESK